MTESKTPSHQGEPAFVLDDFVKRAAQQGGKAAQDAAALENAPGDRNPLRKLQHQVERVRARVDRAMAQQQEERRLRREAREGGWEDDGKRPPPPSDLSESKVAIVTTASLPWMTGTA